MFCCECLLDVASVCTDGKTLSHTDDTSLLLVVVDQHMEADGWLDGVPDQM